MVWVLGGWSSDVQRIVWVPGGWSSDVQEMAWLLGGWSSDAQRMAQLPLGWSSDVQEMVSVLGGWSFDVQRKAQGRGGWSADVQEMVWELGRSSQARSKSQAQNRPNPASIFLSRSANRNVHKPKYKYCLDGPPIVNPRYDLSGNTVLMVLLCSRNGIGARGMVL